MAETDTPVVQSTSDSHDQVGATFFGVAEYIFYNPAPLDAGNDVFHSDTNAGNQTVEESVRDSEGLTFRLLAWLQGSHTGRLIPLKSRVFSECGLRRIANRFGIGDFFVVGFTAVGAAEIDHPARVFVDEDHVFIGVRLFLPL